MLSEINLKYKSDNERYTIRWQLSNWYNINPPKNLGDIELLKYASKFSNKLIVLRGYNFIDFTPSIFNKFKPNKKLNNLNILSKYFNVKHFSFNRKPIDIYRSMATSSHKIEDPDFIFYKENINELIKNNVKLFHYEDLCRNEIKFIKNLFYFIGLKFKSTLLINLDNQKILGDILPTNNSRAYNKKKIIQLKDKPITKILDQKLLATLEDISNDVSTYSNHI